jgi:TonB-linked SusC/RagA family outer membrane protein
MKRLSLVLTLLLFSVATLVAQRTITGKVVDDQNEPLIGASILIKGTSTGTVTDIDGSYSISLPAGSNVLIFSYTGYSSKEITVGASNVVDATLDQESTLLSEIVVTGYSEVERKKLVASVAVVDNRAINNVPMPDVNQLIQGRATGVLSSAPSGQPGAQQTIRIRGTGSINAGRGPLYVIDGIIVETGNFTQTTNTNDVLSNLNPNDIENVTILKDAAATALYGSRGSNGVVLINTKRGKAGRSVITVKGQYGVTQPNTGKFELMNADEIWNYERKMLANSGRTPEQIEAARPVSLLNNAFDWVDAAFRTGNTYNLEAQASGGNEKTRFFTSAGYFRQDGILIESDFSRLSLRTNIDHRATDKLDFQVNLNGSYTDNLNAVAGNRFASPLLGAFVNTPLQSATDPVTGKLYTGQETAWTIFTRDNFLYSQPLNPVINVMLI